MSDELQAAPADARVFRRPHYVRRGAELFFLESRRPMLRLDERDTELWDSLADAPTLADLQARFGQDVVTRVRKLESDALCDVVRPRLKERRRVLIIEPHSDDAALSVGATMWSRRDECEFTLVTVASRSNFTSYFYLDREYFDVEAVTALRNAEAAAFMRLLGGHHSPIGILEATLRYRDGTWSLDFYRAHQTSIAAFNNHRATEAELEHWKDALRSVLRETNAEELWLPLGVGNHTDHELTRNAWLSLLVEEPKLFADRPIRLFADVPYDAQFARHADRIIKALEDGGARLVPAPVAIADNVKSKLRLLTTYASQFKLSALEKDVLAAARRGPDESVLVERFWNLERPPRTVDPIALCADAPIVERATPKARRWLERYRDTRAIRVLLLMPSGRWAEDASFLLDTFPAATLHVYSAPATAAEVTAFESPRIRIHRVSAGGRAWGLLALRLAAQRPVPTVFLSGTARVFEARVLARLWPLSAPIVTPTMDHFIQALRRAKERGPSPQRARSRAAASGRV